MKILLLSDMHFEYNDNSQYKIECASKIAKVVNEELSENEKLLVLNLGDIVNQGDSAAYQKAEEFYNILKNELSIDTDYAFVPGNHDYCGDDKLMHYDQFISKYSTVYCNFDFKSTFVLKYDEISFILSKSTLDAYFDKEQNKRVEIVDVSKDEVVEAVDLANELANPVLVMHHGILSKEGTDFIKGQDKIIALNNKYGFQCYIHGHEHSKEKEYLKVQHNNIITVSAGNCFRHPKADIPQFSILNVHCGYITDRKIFECKYDDYEYSSTENIQDVKYSNLCLNDDDYIPRRLINLKDYENEYFKSRFERPANDVLNDNKTIIVLGEAGSGKSYFSKNYIAQQQKLNNRVQLVLGKNYKGEQITDLISPELSKNINDLILFIDGLDEIKSNHIVNFLKEINEFRAQHNSKVVITARINEYKKICQENEILTEFPAYVLCDFEYEDTLAYLSKKGIKSEDFMLEISRKTLYPFHLKPFYLYHLSSYYLAYKTLPKQNEFFYEMIDKEVEKTISRLSRNGVIIGKNEIKRAFYIIGFTMLCTGDNSFTIKQAKDIVKTIGINDIYDTGILKANNNSVEFCHNNFKEYSAAQFLLEFDNDEVIEIVSTNRKTIRQSWVNAISFYISNKIRNSKVVNYILENDLTAISNIETDRMTQDEKAKIYHTVLKNSIDTGVRIENLVSKENVFSNFVNNAQDILDLLKIIEDGDDGVALIDAFVLLSNKKNLFDYEEKIYDTTIEFFENNIDNHKDYVISEGIDMLADLRLCSDDTKVQQILNLFRTTKSDRILYSLYRFIQTVNEPYKYVGDILDIELNKNITSRVHCGSDFCLNQYLLQIEDFDAIMKFISLYSDSKLRIYDKDKILGKYLNIIKRNDCWIKNSKDELLKILSNHRFFHQTLTKKFLISYFTEVNMMIDVLMYLINYKNGDYLFILNDSLDEKTEMYFCDLYVEDKLPNKYDFTGYVRQMDKSSKNYKHFVDCIKSKGDEKELINKYEKQNEYEKLANQKHFDLMFCFEAYMSTFRELFKGFIDQNWTMKKFFDDYVMKKYDVECKDEEFYLRDVFYYDMHHCLSDDDYLSNFECRVNPNALWYVQRMFNMISGEKVYVSQEQINYFRTYCNNYLKTELIKDIERMGKKSIPWTIVLFAKITCQFGFIYEDSFVKYLLLIPGYAYNENQMGVVSTYLLENYKDSLINRFMDEIITESFESLNVELCCGYLNYYLEKNLPTGIVLAEKMLLDQTIDQYYRESALKYIMQMKADEAWIDSLSFDHDRKLLDIVYRHSKNPHSNVVEAYKTINQQDTNHIDGLAELLKLKDIDAVNLYVTYCKNNMKVPDFHGANSYPSITDKIVFLNELRFLNQLAELLIIKSSDKFNDISDFGLYNSLSKAFVGISKNNYVCVIEKLDELISTYPNNKSLIQNCSYIKRAVEENAISSEEFVYDIESTLELIK